MWFEFLALAVIVAAGLVGWYHICKLNDDLIYATGVAERAIDMIPAQAQRVTDLNKTMHNVTGRVAIQREEIDSINSRMALAAELGSVLMNAALSFAKPDQEDEPDGIALVERVTGLKLTRDGDYVPNFVLVKD